MPEQKLRETLAELESELEQIDSLDDETRRLLAETMGDIAETLLEKREPEDPESESFIDRLKGVGDDIYQSHPTTGRLVSRLIDILGQMGI